jgi:phage repressor protein C with HTH and peptisase S24 domain
MSPTLQSGDILLVKSSVEYAVGNIVVTKLDAYDHIVKRVRQVNGESLALEGDNPRLGSSVTEREIPRSSAVGTVLASYRFPLKLSFLFLETR